MNSNQTARQSGITTLLATLLCVAVPLLLTYWHAAFGLENISALRILHNLGNTASGETTDLLLHYLRLPRTLAAIAAGASLAMAGALFQVATRNPLASPGILGVTAGAQLCIALVTLFPALASVMPPTLAACIGGLLAGYVTWMISRTGSASPVRIALSGMAVSLMASAIAAALALIDETSGTSLYIWGGGSLAQADWSTPVRGLIGLIAAFVLALLLARQFDILALGDETAHMLGQNLPAIRGSALLLGVWASALAVTMAGPVVFVGLIAPNLIRMCGVTRDTRLLPASIAVGIALTLSADLVVLAMATANMDLPVSVPLAVLGAPWLITLARRTALANYASSEFFRGGHTRGTGPKGPVVAWLVILLGLLCMVSLASGNRLIFPEAIGSFLVGKADPALSQILDMRLLRISGAALAGSLLGISGLLLQGVIRNPLASPELIGITQTSGFMAVLVILVFPGLGLAGVQAGAMAGGIGTAIFVGMVGLSKGIAPSSMALMGLGIAALASAASTALVIGGGFQASQAATWLAGSVYGVRSFDIVLLASGLALCLPITYFLLSVTDALAFGRQKATSLGISVRTIEWSHLLLGAATASFVAATFGPVSFVGLMAPHAAKRLSRGRYRQALWPTVLVGAMLMVLADCLGRVLLAPIEIPIGLMTAILGAPFILLILKRG